jgi:hypothetical protein
MTGLMALIAITTYSCKKEGNLQVQNGSCPGLSVSEIPSNEKALGLDFKNVLGFATIADYKTAITNPTDAQQTALYNSIASFTTFTSYTTLYPNSLLFKNEDLTDLLNPDGVILIGDNYFKVDPTVDKVFVLPKADIAYYYDLISPNPVSGKVVMFSTYEDVIELIEAGALLHTQVATVSVPEVMTATGQKGLRSFFVKLVSPVVNVIKQAYVTVVETVSGVSKNVTNTISQVIGTDCSETGIGSQFVSKPFDVQSTASAQYTKWGIYFHLFATVSPVSSSSNQYNFAFVGGIGSTVAPVRRDSGYVAYHVKCNQTIGTEVFTKGHYKWNSFSNVFVYHSYKGTHPLNKVYFKFSILDNNKVNSWVPKCPLVGFRTNM